MLPCVDGRLTTTGNRWNDDIKNLRTKCLRARRVSQKTMGSVIHEMNDLNYKRLRKELCNAIRNSKKQYFKSLCEEANSNPTGYAYKAVMTRSTAKGKGAFLSQRRDRPICFLDSLGKVLENIIRDID